MKIKLDFITNSSSCNFIITCSGHQPNLKIPMVIEVDLARYVTDTLQTESDVLEYARDNYLDDAQDYMELVKSGKTVYLLECGSDSDDPIERMLCGSGIDSVPGFEVLQGEGGY